MSIIKFPKLFSSSLIGEKIMVYLKFHCKNNILKTNFLQFFDGMKIFFRSKCVVAYSTFENN